MSNQNINISSTGTGEHVEHVHRDDYASKLGMWMFLFTELLLFGGLFLCYMAFRYQYSAEFQLSAKELKIYMGTVNTIVLLTSSLTVVLSIIALQRGSKKLSIFYLVTTIAFAIGFLVIKGFEWAEKFHHGIYPGSLELKAKSHGEIVFFGLYYSMTGLHALHVIIGMAILLFMLVGIVRNKITKDNFVRLENGGLYWHLVDLIWIFLFPLFYLLH